MLDSVPAVRVAAADALKSIDPKMQYLAVGLATAESSNQRRALFLQIKKLETDGEPLAVLVAYYTIVQAGENSPDTQMIQEGMATLGSIARNDMVSCRLLATALENKNPDVRRVALQALATMKHGKQFVKKITALLVIDDVADNQVAAIRTLTALADASNEETIAEAIARQRYHKEEKVRQAVEFALNKLKNSKNP
jgi:HEAT repeat protein